MSDLISDAVAGRQGLGRGPRDDDDPRWSEAPAWRVRRVGRAAPVQEPTAVALDRGEDLTKSAFAWATNGARLRQYRACVLFDFRRASFFGSDAGSTILVVSFEQGRPTAKAGSGPAALAPVFRNS
jgi:hypothetical protein